MLKSDSQFVPAKRRTISADYGQKLASLVTTLIVFDDLFAPSTVPPAGRPDDGRAWRPSSRKQDRYYGRDRYPSSSTLSALVFNRKRQARYVVGRPYEAKRVQLVLSGAEHHFASVFPGSLHGTAVAIDTCSVTRHWVRRTPAVRMPDTCFTGSASGGNRD